MYNNVHYGLGCPPRVGYVMDGFKQPQPPGFRAPARFHYALGSTAEWDLSTRLAEIYEDNANSESDPGSRDFWTAYDLASELRSFIHANTLPVAYDPQTDSWDLDPWVDRLVAIIKTMQVVQQFVDSAMAQGYVPTPSSRAEKRYIELQANVEKIYKHAVAVEAGIHDGSQQAIQEARRAAAAQGADLSDMELFVERLHKSLSNVVQTPQDEAAEAWEKVKGEAENALKGIAWGDVMKVVVPVAVVGGVALMLLHKSR